MTLAAVEPLDVHPSSLAEVIVVDDASTDGTSAALQEKHPNVRRLSTSRRVGYANAVNLGVKSSAGELIWLLNSDTIVCPDAVEHLISNFERDPDLGISGAALFYPGGAVQWSGGRFPGVLWLFGQASGLPGLLGRVPMWRRIKPVSGTATCEVDWVTGAAMALRREVWDGVGPLHEAYRFYCQDLDLCWRAKKQGWKISVLPDVRVIHHHGGTIRSDSDAVGVVQATHMWLDLVQFFVIHHGAQAGKRAARSIQIGGWLRVMIRNILALFVAPSNRGQWRADTRAYVSALREIARTASALHGS